MHQRVGGLVVSAVSTEQWDREFYSSLSHAPVEKGGEGVRPFVETPISDAKGAEYDLA